MGYDASSLSVRSRLGQPPIEVIIVGFEIQGCLFEADMGHCSRAQRVEDSLSGREIL